VASCLMTYVNVRIVLILNGVVTGYTVLCECDVVYVYRERLDFCAYHQCIFVLQELVYE